MTLQLSIIIPVYNAEKSIAKTLSSVCWLPKTNFELIVIDGNSTDRSLEIISTYMGEIDHLLVEDDKGVYDAMNKGINLAQGEWILFLGADDELVGKDLLEEMVASKHEGESLRIGGVKNIDADHSKTPEFYPGRWDQSLYWRNTAHHQGILYHKDVFKERRYNLRYPVLADYHLNLLLFQEGVKAKRFDRILVHCEAQGLSKRYTMALYQEEWQVKKDAVKGLRKWIQPSWLVCKFIYKQVF